MLVYVKSIWLMLAKEANFLLTHLTDSLTTLITNLYVTTGLAGILLAMAIESCCIPLPSEIVMPLAGIMVYNHKILSGLNPVVSIILVALAGAIGCLIGSIVAYWIGYRGGRPLMLKYGRYVLISQHDADKADRYFQRWGSATVFFSRLLPVVRTYISLPAGIAEMPFAKFCVYTFLGSFPWCLLLAYLGTILGANLEKLTPYFRSFEIVILLVLALLVGLYIWRHIRNDRIARAALASKLSASMQSAPQPPRQGLIQQDLQQPLNQQPQQEPYPPQQGWTQQAQSQQQQFQPRQPQSQQSWPSSTGDNDRTIRRD